MPTAAETLADDTSCLQGRVLVVTGGAGAIGREIALLAARHGARVLVNDIGGAVDGSGGDRTAAEQVAQAIRAQGGQAQASVDSVATPAGAAHIVQAALDHFGRVDCVVNNAGNARNAIFHKMAVDDWEAVLQVHLHGSFHLSRAAAPHLRAQQSGAFVHMTSTGGLVGNVGQANYMAAKMALTALSKGIALDMGRFGVRSNCVAPLAKSRLTALFDAGDAAARARGASFDKLPAAAVAPLVVYLCSDAAAEVTGQVLVARGSEILVMSQPRPLRAMHRDGGWTVDSLARHGMPGLRPAFVPLEVSGDVFNWDPL
jgi:NAD(P)-dependent dehydrogenase (short-subunit alcohol dehydrogenase family)